MAAVSGLRAALVAVGAGALLTTTVSIFSMLYGRTALQVVCVAIPPRVSRASTYVGFVWCMAQRRREYRWNALSLLHALLAPHRSRKHKHELMMRPKYKGAFEDEFR